MIALLCLEGFMVSGPLFADDLSKKDRDSAARHQRRIIMNNDGNDGRLPGLTQMIEEFLNSRTSPLRGSQVDAFFLAQAYSVSTRIRATRRN
jgi:hypothetical protein